MPVIIFIVQIQTIVLFGMCECHKRICSMSIHVEGIENETNSLDVVINANEVQMSSSAQMTTVTWCMYSNGNSLQVTGTSIRSLGLKSLKFVQFGKVVFSRNKNLCYVDTIDWKSIVTNPAEQRVIVQNNKNSTVCSKSTLLAMGLLRSNSTNYI